MLFSVFMLALRSVRRNMLRSFLTILGIVIGVSSVITMVTLGNGATQAIQMQITSLGTNLLMVMPGQRTPLWAQRLRAQQLQAVENAIHQAKKILIQDHLDHCLEDLLGSVDKDQQNSIEEFKEITRYL